MVWKEREEERGEEGEGIGSRVATGLSGGGFTHTAAVPLFHAAINGLTGGDCSRCGEVGRAGRLREGCLEVGVCLCGSERGEEGGEDGYRMHRDG